MQFSLEIWFYGAKYQNLRPIFAAASKNIFGKMVALFGAMPISYSAVI